MNSIRDSYAYQATNAGLLGEIQIAINGINLHLIALESGLGAVAANVEILNGMTFTEIETMINDTASMNLGDIFNNASKLGISGAGILGIVAGISADIMYNTYLTGQIKELQKMNNSNITEIQKNNYIGVLKQSGIDNYRSLNNLFSNLNTSNGFINSNITTPQFISSISTNEIKLNNISLSNVVKNQILYNEPNLDKKFGFICQVNTPFYPNYGNELFYKYDIYLPSYTINKIVEYTSDPYRVFEINLFYAPGYFAKIFADLPDIINYRIYMSNKANSAAPFGDAGINICAIGEPRNYQLNKIMPNNLFLMRDITNNFNYLTIVSRRIADCRVIITDILN